MTELTAFLLLIAVVMLGRGTLRWLFDRTSDNHANPRQSVGRS